MPEISSLATEERITLTENASDFLRQNLTVVMMLNTRVSLYKC